MKPQLVNYNPKDLEKRMEEIRTCGKNRGPHDYIPVVWLQKTDSENVVTKYVSKFMCRICFNSVSMETLMRQHKDLSIKY